MIRTYWRLWRTPQWRQVQREMMAAAWHLLAFLFFDWDRAVDLLESNQLKALQMRRDRLYRAALQPTSNDR